MFFMFVNDEEPISYFNLVFLFFFFVFLVLGGERHKMGVKRLIYPSFNRGGLRHINGDNHKWVKCQNLNHR